MPAERVASRPLNTDPVFRCAAFGRAQLSQFAGKSKQVGSTPAEILAEQLLRDLVKEGKA